MNGNNAFDNSGDLENGPNATVPIAIVGLALEFPQDATSEQKFWKLLCEGRSTSTDFPRDRINIDAFYNADDSRTTTLPFRGGHFVKEDLGAFDAPFFSITPGEAACMDPQHRHMLETAYHALEDAGMPLSQCCGSDTAVYTGCFTNDYYSVLQQDFESEHTHAALGIAYAMLANRVSWFFDFKGPSVNLDSACSSSLVGLHMACQDLRTQSVSMALVGGANLIYHPEFLKMMANMNFLSPDSRSWSFDERANGYARGEGISVLVLKRLSDALKDGDTIRGIIRNTGTNQDGRTPGITVPNQDAQINLIQRTFRDAHLSMDPVRFFEAHGTGTPTGDPVEAGAIGKAMMQCRSGEDPLYIGAVKSNIGHLEGGSGLAGIIKTVLVLEQGLIPPIADLTDLNKQIDEAGLHLKFPKQLTKWPKAGLRRACVNSFGFGGTNAVAILDDVHHYLSSRQLSGYHRTIASHTTDCVQPTTEPHDTLSSTTSPIERPTLLVYAGADRDTTLQIGESIHQYATRHEDRIADLAYTLAKRRSHLAWRSFDIMDPSVKPPPPEMDIFKPVKAANANALAFVFTGQGAQYVEMGAGLEIFPAFQKSLVDLDECLEKIGCSWSLLEMMRSGMTKSMMDQPEYSQTLTTCLQIALVDTLKSFGISPSVVLGHSSGEICAAYTAGALSQLSAVKVAYWRGILSSKLAETVCDLGMMAVGLSRDAVSSYLQRLKKGTASVEVSIGCVNSSKSITLTGSTTQLAMLEEWFRQDSIFARRLHVPVAYHSKFMDAIVKEYKTAMGDLEMGTAASKTPPVMLSSVTGDVVLPQDVCKASYWVSNMTSTVEFETAFSKVLALSAKKKSKKLGRKNVLNVQITHTIEIGPHSTLRGPIREIVQASEISKTPKYTPSLIRGSTASIDLLKLAGTLHCDGYPVDILAVNNIPDQHRAIPRDLPPYPFNHKQSYWKESRLSKNFRFREAPRHDLLGTRSFDWNPRLAQWRNVIRLSELPWLEDHRINNQAVFPAAGMISMAVEALKQLVNDGSHLAGVQVKKTSFLHPMRFAPDTNSVEVQLTIAVAPISVYRGNWSRFRLFTIENDEYVECCNGVIRPVFDHKDEDETLDTASFSGIGEAENWTKNTYSRCQEIIRNPYSLMVNSAITFGPCFQSLENMKFGNKGEAHATVNTRAWKLGMARKTDKTFAIHPASLDGLAQLLLLRGAKAYKDLPLMVPTRVDSIWFDIHGLKAAKGKDLSATAQCRLRNRRGGAADIVATQLGDSHPLICFTGLETSFIDGLVSKHSKSDEQAPYLCAKLLWKPDIDTMSDQQVLTSCTQDRPSEPLSVTKNSLPMQLAMMSFVIEALRFVREHPAITVDNHLKTYIEWMEYQEGRTIKGEAEVEYKDIEDILQNESARNKLIKQIEDSGVEGFFFMHIGRNIIKVLSGDVDPLDLMFRSDLADRYYEQMLANEYHIHPILAYLDLLCFKNPSMKILEVGAGTGGQTLRILNSMALDGVKKWAQFDYTDISPSYFERVREKFQDYAGVMNFQVFDVSKDPVKQSFAEGTYDLVLAAHVLHATDNMGESLRNIRKLLKPDGKLLLVETTRPDFLNIGFAFGLLKGWWQPLDQEKRSRLSPCLTTSQWNSYLQQSGFSGVDLEFLGQHDKIALYSSIIVSSATTQSVAFDSTADEIAVVRNPSVSIQNAVAGSITTRIPKCDSYTFAELMTAELPPSTMVVFLVEMDTSLLDRISATDYNLLKSILLRHTSTLWVTKTPLGDLDPHQQLATGFGRALSSEDPARKFVTLALENGDAKPDSVADMILKITQRTIHSPVEQVENNYVATSDTLSICRISQNHRMDAQVSKTNSDYHSENVTLGPDTQLALQYCPPGSFGLEFRDDNTEILPFNSDEIVVETKALGVNHRDVLLFTGELDGRDVFTECSGIVKFAGHSSGFTPGDRVCLLSMSAGRTLVRTNASSAVPIPSHVSFNDAVAMSTSLWLSYHSLVNIGRVRPDDVVLIHRASSTFGQMAVQIALKSGAQVIVTASSAAKRAFLHKQFNLPEQAVLSSDDHGFVERIRQATNDRDVDIVVGALSHDTSIDFSHILAPFGRLVDIGLRSPNKAATLSFGNSDTNTMHANVDMIKLLKSKPNVAHQIFRQAMQMGLEKQLNAPQPINTFGADEIDQAWSHLQDTSNFGKRVIEFRPDTSIMANIKTKPTYTFSADATYVIAGGLGGLGRCISRWLVSRGVKNLALLSRSGPKSEAAQTLLKELKNKGVHCVTPKTDASDIDQLKQTFDEISATMPPIKGCFQAIVTLRDNLFEKMSHEDWSVSTSGKVTSSWNLHKVLPDDLDFFILLSSIGGVYGARAQANYAAGNTFKDALARYRVSRGQKAVAFDLGFMVDEGIVAESDFLTESMRRIGLLMEIKTEQFLALLDYYCNPDLPVLSESEVQIITGMELPAVILNKGFDLHYALRRPLTSQLFVMESHEVKRGLTNSNGSGNAAIDRIAELAKAKTEVEATERVTEWLLWKLGLLIGRPVSDIDANDPVHAYGIDSLVAIELKNWVNKEIGAEISVFELLSNIPIKTLSALVISKLKR